MTVLMPEPGEPLTPREREVMVALATSDTLREAAERLGIAKNTVWVHQAHVNAKLGTTSRQAAWRALGWLVIPRAHDAHGARRPAGSTRADRAQRAKPVLY